MAYTKTSWVNGGAPAISAANLNKVEDGIFDAHNKLDDIGSSVKEFGAVGDGSTDDRAAIASADAAGTFYLPAGRYRIGSNLTISSRVYFYDGAVIEPDSLVTVTFNGLIHGPQHTYPFGGAGTISRPNIVSNVPTDYATVQKAIDACPRFLYQQYNVEISTGNYNEDVVIRNIYAADTLTGIGNVRFAIKSATGIASDVTLNSVLIVGCHGGTGHPTINDMTFDGETPGGASGGKASILAYGSRGAELVRLRLRANNIGEKVGILAYNSVIDVNDMDFGTNLYNYGYKLKHGGIINDVGAQGVGTGTFNKSVVDAGSGIAMIQDLGNYSSTSVPVTCKFNADGAPDTTRSGIVIDGRSGQIWGSTSGFGPNLPAIHIQSVMESLSRYGVSQIGTGSASVDSTGVVFQTGASSGSVAQVALNMGYSLSQTTNFSSPKDFSFAVELPVGVTDADWVLSLGHRANAVNAIRFKGNGDTLKVSVHNGTSETETTVVASGYGGKHVLRAVFYPGKRVIFFDNGAVVAQISTGLPTGNLGDPRISMDLRNTTANNRQMTVYQYEYKDMKVV